MADRAPVAAEPAPAEKAPQATGGDSDEGEELDEEEEAAAAAANNKDGSGIDDEGSSKAATVKKKKATVTVTMTKSPRALALEEEAAKVRETKLQARSAISEFESHRRGYFGPQIHSNVTHWHAFTATLTKSIVENDRVLEFFNKRLQVDAKYAEALSELPTVDLKGGGGWTAASSSSKKGDTSSKTKATTSSSSKAGGGAGTTKASAGGGGGLPAMDELVSSTEGVGAKVSQFVANTKTTIVDEKIKILVSVFRSTSEEILSEGQVSLENIAKSEKAVQAAYDDYSKAAEHLSLSGQQGGGVDGAGGVTGLASASSDLWLADMNYRVAVELQQHIWRESQEKLYALFGRMKQLELGRRQTLHTLVLRFVQAQGELWAQLPQVATGTALRISEFKTDPHEVEAQIGEEIRSGAKAAQDKESAASSASTLTRSKSTVRSSSFSSPPSARRAASDAAPPPPPPHPGSPPPPTNEPFNESLKSPLEINLVKRVEVLEHRVTTGLESLPLMKRWRPALVVITLDNFLHVFDLPAEVSSVASVGEAFKVLVPNPIDAKGKFKRGKDAERVYPSVSVLVDASKAKHKPEEGAESFEVVEKVNNSGFVKVFKAQEVTKVVLKTRTQEKMVDWCVAINGTAAAAPPTTASPTNTTTTTTSI